ncbi:MAG: SH3 domain-containing protein [Anaerolineales bacterium]|nr:SH3 domain-containing protein [Anaerolineales bacterium]
MPTPTPTNKWYRVTASPSLRVRDGAGTNFSQIGSVLLNEVVQEVDANSDRSWLKIRNADGTLTGWVSSEFLQLTTPTEPTPPPDEEDENWYRVTASPSLRVRQGPGLEHESVGLVYFAELVEKLDSTLDGTWLKIRNQEGSLVGWSSSQYLVSVHSPEPIPPPPPATVPDHKNKNWYRVNTTTLNLRDAPNLTGKVVGKVSKNDVIPALDDSSNTEWAQIQKIDGLTAWCSKTYLVQVANTRPDSISQSIHTGITYLRKDLTTPRPIVVHVMAIDLQTAKLEFLVTPPSKNGGDVLCTRTTSQFLDEFKLHVAINGGYFSYLDASFDPKKLCPNGGEPVRISDYAASRGNIYSKKKTWQPVIYIGQKNQFSFNTLAGKVFNAISGDRPVVTDGKVVKNLAALAPAPRTAIGLNKNGRWLTFMVVDGRQAGYSEGVTLSELGELLLSYGVHTGINMDGGGSSALVIRGFDNKSRTLNSPIDLGQPGKERRVGNHLGFLVK